MNQEYYISPFCPPARSAGRQGWTSEALPPGLPWWFYGPPASPVPPPSSVQMPVPTAPGGVLKLAYSVEEAAEALGVSRSLVYQLIHKGGFPSVKLRDRLAAAWPFIKGKIDRNAEMYRKKCEKAAKAINARWEKKGKKD